MDAFPATRAARRRPRAAFAMREGLPERLLGATRTRCSRAPTVCRTASRRTSSPPTPIARCACRMVSVNRFGVGARDTFFGGRKESGYGSEGGPEAVEEYLVRKLISQR